jgi:hypothetical protein
MLIIYGIYHFLAKRVAFRNDFCLTCKTPRLAQRIRTLDVIHIFWIPLIPLGFWKRWKCTVCNADPHAAPGTRRPFKWIGFAILVLLGPVFWFMPPDPEFPLAALWACRIGFPVGAVLLMMHLMKTPEDISLKERLAQIPPAAGTTCPFCGTNLLILASEASCPQCKVVRV